MADVLAFRMKQRPVRVAAGISTIDRVDLLPARPDGRRGALVSLLLGVNSQAAKNITIIAVGALMIFYVTVGGMKGTTWVQIIKAVLLMTGTTLVTVLVMVKFGGSVSALLGTAAAASGKGDAFLEPGLRFGTEAQGICGQARPISLGLAPGARQPRPAAHPRAASTPCRTPRRPRKSVLWAIGIIGSF
jgi:cation/acetate symporter